MKSVDVDFRSLTRASRDDGATFLVHIEHQFGCFLEGIAEQLLKNECDVRHEIDGVVPHEDDPRRVEVDRGVDFVLLYDVRFDDRRLARDDGGGHVNSLPAIGRIAVALVP